MRAFCSRKLASLCLCRLSRLLFRICITRIYAYTYMHVRTAGYPIPINFNDERGQFNTSWTHCSKLVGNKSYVLVTEKCMTQISAAVICYTHTHTHTHSAYPVASLLCALCVIPVLLTRIHRCTLCIAVRQRDIVLIRDQNTLPLALSSHHNHQPAGIKLRQPIPPSSRPSSSLLFFYHISSPSSSFSR